MFAGIALAELIAPIVLVSQGHQVFCVVCLQEGLRRIDLLWTVVQHRANIARAPGKVLIPIPIEISGLIGDLLRVDQFTSLEIIRVALSDQMP